MPSTSSTLATGSPAPQAAAAETACYVDAHVHIYPCHDVDKALDAAIRNTRRTSSAEGSVDRSIAILLLADWRRARSFERCLKHQGKWHTSLVQEGILAAEAGADQCLILEGQQIDSRENIEVLSLCSMVRHKAGLPLEDLINAIGDCGALPVIPWGVGKWIGARGRALSEFLERPSAQRVYLGDSYNRPIGWREPVLLERGRHVNGITLSGTDPLPLPSSTERIGRFGVCFTAPLDISDPLRTIITSLQQPSQIRSFGRRQSFGGTVWDQTRLRLARQ